MNEYDIFAKKNEVKTKEIKNSKLKFCKKLRIILSLIWPTIKNTEAGPIWDILIKKYLV